MFDPRPGDVLLRGSLESGFIVQDALSRKPFGTVGSFADAIQLAQERGASCIWQQHLDDRGRSIGPPFRISLLGRARLLRHR
jgi:hypothetical protein